MKKILILMLILGTSFSNAFVRHFKDINRSTGQTFNQFIMNNEYVVVKFSMDGCPPCRKLAPKFQTLSNISSFVNIKFVELNIRNFRSVSENYRIRSVPCVKYFKNGTVVGSHTGGNISVETMSNNIKRYFAL